MFGLKEIFYPAHVLISFWCDSDNKNFNFFTFQNFSRYFSFVHIGYDQNLVIHVYLYTPARIISKYLLALGNLPGKFFWRFSAFSTDGDARFAPQANLVCFETLHALYIILNFIRISCVIV